MAVDDSASKINGVFVSPIAENIPGCFNLVLAEEDAYNNDYFFVNAQPGGNGALVTWNSASEAFANCSFRVRMPTSTAVAVPTTRTMKTSA